MPKRGNPNPSPATRLKPGNPGRPKGVKNKVTREMVERELRHIAFVNPNDMFVKVGRGKASVFMLKSVQEMPEGLQRSLASIKVRRENLKAGDGEQDETIEVRLVDKVRSLELCARMLGMLKDKVEITAPEEHLGRLDRAKARALGEKKIEP